MSKLPRPSGKEMVRFLIRAGFIVVRIRGSHHVMQKGELHTTVSVHGNEPLKIGTLHGILRNVRMTPEEFEKRWGE